MSNIYAVRHGDYARGDRWAGTAEALTMTGREQMRQAGEELAALEYGKSWQILSSAARRAMESATILGGVVDAEPVPSERIMRAGNTPYYARDNFMGLVREAMGEAGVEYNPDQPLAVVTHMPLVACVAGDPRLEVPNGGFFAYDPAVWRSI